MLGGGFGRKKKMGTLPAFQDFLDDIDRNIFSYDIENYTRGVLEEYNGVEISQRELRLLVKVAYSVSVSMLSQYHQWLNEQLSQ